MKPRLDDLLHKTAHPIIKRRLRTMDIFCGAGGLFFHYYQMRTISIFILGLAKGLEASGLAETLWACDCDEKAAEAFLLNHPNAAVYCRDINTLLEERIKVSWFFYFGVIRLAKFFYFYRI